MNPHETQDDSSQIEPSATDGGSNATAACSPRLEGPSDGVVAAKLSTLDSCQASQIPSNPDQHATAPPIRGPLWAAVGLLQLIHRNPTLAEVATQQYRLHGDMFAAGDPAYHGVRIVACAALRLTSEMITGCTCVRVLPLLAEFSELPEDEDYMRGLSIRIVRLLEVLESRPGVTESDFGALARQVIDSYQEHRRRIHGHQMCRITNCLDLAEVRFPDPCCEPHARARAKRQGVPYHPRKL